MHHSAARWRSVVVALVLAAHVGTLLAPAAALAQTGAKPATPSNVQKGQEYYEQSRFDEAITLLKDLVDRGLLQGEDMQKARELLARSYVKKGYPVQAKEMFKAILRAEPAWRPDPIRVPPDETAVFEQALKEFQEETPAPAAPKPQPTQPTTPTMTPGTTTTAPSGEVKKKKMGWWVYALGAVAIGGIAAAAGGGGGGDGGGGGTSNALPYFPNHP